MLLGSWSWGGMLSLFEGLEVEAVNLDEVINRLAAACRCRRYAVKDLQCGRQYCLYVKSQSLYDIRCIVFLFISSSCKLRLLWQRT